MVDSVFHFLGIEMSFNFGDSLNIYGVSLFCVLGFMNGYLFRRINLLKIIAVFFVLPFSIDLLVGLNILLGATFPFLFFALIGFLGARKIKSSVLGFTDFLGDLVRRFKWMKQS